MYEFVLFNDLNFNCATPNSLQIKNNNTENSFILNHWLIKIYQVWFTYIMLWMSWLNFFTYQNINHASTLTILNT